MCIRDRNCTIQYLADCDSIVCLTVVLITSVFAAPSLLHYCYYYHCYFVQWNFVHSCICFYIYYLFQKAVIFTTMPTVRDIVYYDDYENKRQINRSSGSLLVSNCNLFIYIYIYNNGLPTFRFFNHMFYIQLCSFIFTCFACHYA